jgi:hypothetical protein
MAEAVAEFWHPTGPVEDFDIPHVPAPHVNLPDGALTDGYCRHHWWC